MNRIPVKSPRLRLAPESYENLRQQVLRRDGWRCQSCGALSHLEVHHRELRSQSGDDAEQNLITLCTACHSIVHRGTIEDGLLMAPALLDCPTAPSIILFERLGIAGACEATKRTEWILTGTEK
jgi:hypothetical protein